jgi:hypothetical protein
VEWARAKARADRWTEEAILTTEEMRRNIAYAKHAQERWSSIAYNQAEGDLAVVEGKRGYAAKRARYECDLIATFPGKWQRVLDRAKTSILLQDKIIDALAEMPGKGKGREEAAEQHAVVLMVRGLDGLALSTDYDDAHEPTYVFLSFISYTCLTCSGRWALASA